MSFLIPFSCTFTSPKSIICLFSTHSSMCVLSHSPLCLALVVFFFQTPHFSCFNFLLHFYFVFHQDSNPKIIYSDRHRSMQLPLIHQVCLCHHSSSINASTLAPTTTMRGQSTTMQASQHLFSLSFNYLRIFFKWF